MAGKGERRFRQVTRRAMIREASVSGSPTINNNAGAVVVVLRDHVLSGRSKVRSKAVHRIHVIADVHFIGTAVDQRGNHAACGEIEGVDVGYRVYVSDKEIVAGCRDR